MYICQITQWLHSLIPIQDNYCTPNTGRNFWVIWKDPDRWIQLCEHKIGFWLYHLLPKNLENLLKENLKVIYKIKNQLKNIFEDERVVTKILKMDENNQYGNGMTKPHCIGSINWSTKLAIFLL